MEFDNDRKRKHANKIEIYFWVLLCILYPLLNTLDFSTPRLKMAILLLLINIIIFPTYFFYASVIVRKYLFPKKYMAFMVSGFLFFVVLLSLLAGVYQIIDQFNLPPAEQSYFNYNYHAITRECLWTAINMSIATAIAFINKANNDSELLLSLQKTNVSFQLKYLRAQLNPHFLFNTLNSIYSLSLQKSDKTPELVIKLSDLMRYLIYDCNEDKVLLTREIEFIRNYIAIEKIRYKADIQFTLEGKTEGIMIEPFLFISFIENSFKHAFDSSFTTPFIYITIKVEPGQIVLNVINNSNADLETQAKKINGKGLTNSKSLLELLYPDSYALNIIQTEKEEARKNNLRLENARKRLEIFYPDSHTLDVILRNNAFTVSLIIKQPLLDKMYYR